MKWYSQYNHPDQAYFVIEDGGNVGFYLYVYDNADSFREDTKDPYSYCRNHQQDHLQDTLEVAKQQALEDFGVPLDSWKQVE